MSVIRKVELSELENESKSPTVHKKRMKFLRRLRNKKRKPR